MKAILDAAANAYIIRINEKIGALSEVYVVEEIKVSDECLRRINEVSGNTSEIAAW